MSCIICIFTPNKIVISSDSAVSSDNRTYTGVEKIIPLSNDPPLTIAIYGNSDFGEIPLENIISEYVKKTDFKKINTVVKVKKDFLNYIHEIIPKETIDEFLRKKIRSFKDEIKDLDEIGLIYYFSKCQEKETMNIFENYEFNFDELLPKDLTKTQKEIFNANMNNIFLSLVSDELSGIIIAGIDKKTLKSSYTSFEMLLNEPHSVSIHNENEEIDINGSKIKVFAQNDVIKGFFKGIDDELLSQISSEIENYSNESLDILINKLKKENEISKNDLEKIQKEINLIKENSMIKLEFEDTISNLQKENMGNMLEEIEIMPPEEIIKMSKTLINLTKLKRIISSEQVTVDGRILSFVLTLKKGIEKFY